MPMGRVVTLPRKTGLAKLRAATKAVYFFHGASFYEREVPVAELAAAFEGNSKLRVKVNLADSAHWIELPGVFVSGYRIEF